MGNSYGSLKDPSSQVTVKAVTSQSGTAGGTGDNTEKTSAAIDRMVAGGAGYLSAVLAVGYLTTVASGQTLKVTAKISDSDDGTTFGTDTTLANAVTVETGAVTAKDGCYELGIDLSAYKRYVRLKMTLDLSASATDTFLYSATLVLTGADHLPV